MAESTVSYKCPNCDAGLLFDAEKQKFVCEFCISEFGEEELSATDSAERAERAERENAEFAGEINEYSCPSCGAEVITDKSTVASFCYYCHNPVVLSDRVSGVLKPSHVIPFAFDKEAAIEEFNRYTRKKKFLPRDYFDEENVDKISGIYYPFWVTDADTHSTLEAVGHKVRTWRMGNYRYTETSNFKVRRGGEMHFEDITTSAISEEDKAMLEGILPYPADAYREFSMPYLLGYSAKKRDLDRDALSGEVRDRMHGYATTLLQSTVRGYASVDAPRVGIRIKSSNWSYSLLPIWILTYRKKGRRKDKIYTYAMNGHTGKIYGELPVSIPKLLLLFGGAFLALAALFILIGRFIIL